LEVRTYLFIFFGIYTTMSASGRASSLSSQL